MNDFQRWRELGQQLRVDSIRCSATTRSGHPTSGMSAADLMAVLVDKYFRYEVRAPDNPNNDCLIFSRGTPRRSSMPSTRQQARSPTRSSSASEHSEAGSRAIRLLFFRGWTWRRALSARASPSASASPSLARGSTASRTGSGSCAGIARCPRDRCRRRSSMLPSTGSTT